MSMLKLAIVAIISALTLTGCGSSDSPQSTPVCPANFPVPLVWFPETPDEATLVGKLTGCTDSYGTATFVYNRDESAVWVIDRPVGINWWTVNPDLTVQVFHEVMSSGHFNGLTLEPGQNVTIHRGPAEVHLSLNAQVQAAWQTLSLISDTVKDKSKDGLRRLLAGNSRSRAATVDCLFEGFSIGGQIASLSDSRLPDELLASGLGIYGGARKCAQSIRAAAREGVVTVEEVAGKTKASTWRSATNTLLKIVKIARGLRFRLP